MGLDGKSFLAGAMGMALGVIVLLVGCGVAKNWWPLFICARGARRRLARFSLPSRFRRSRGLRAGTHPVATAELGGCDWEHDHPVSWLLRAWRPRP